MQDYNNLRELFNFSPNVTTQEIEVEFYAQTCLLISQYNEYLKSLPLETQVVLQENAKKEIEALKTEALIEKAVESAIKALKSQDLKEIVEKKI
ncbi:MAG TPA: hypothetical protein PLJ29_00570, partial [Leptospiraceae bacterium]|nr:hypothetical protein [Leptospiraceae bacterium]